MNNNYPKISIIIPVYNVALYIEQCLISISQQTYKNIEILIINDCGEDSSMLLVENFLKRTTDSRFRVIHHDKNLGLSAARNTGIRKATGDFLYFIDSDDFISANCIETFVDIIKKYPDSEVVFGSAIFHPDNNRDASIINVKSSRIPIYNKNKRWLNYAFFKDGFLPLTAWNKLVSQKFIIKNNLFFKEGIVYEDQLWYFIMANFCSKIAFNKNNTYFYRNNPNSITHYYGIKHMDSEIIIIKECLYKIHYKYFIPQIIHIMHFAHTAYCRRYGSSQSIYIRYPKAFIFFIKSIFMKPENLRRKNI